MIIVKLLPRAIVLYFTFKRLYKSGKSDDMHKYTLHPDDPDFIRAKVNAQQISDVSPLYQQWIATHLLKY